MNTTDILCDATPELSPRGRRLVYSGIRTLSDKAASRYREQASDSMPKLLRKRASRKTKKTA
jgi:hypothetical protein